MRHLACLLALVFLCGCNQEALLQKFSTPENQATATGYIDRLRAHDFEAIESAADESIKNPALRGTLEKMADLIPAQEPASVKLVGAQTAKGSGTTTVRTTFEYGFGDQWFLANVAVKEKDGVKTIVGFNVVPEPQSLEAQHRFTLSGKSAAQYLVLGAAITAALLTLYSLVACARTPLLEKKGLWVLFIVFGLGKVAINWTTGQWSVTPIAVQLFSAGGFAPLYGPLTFSVSLPIGAVLFLLYRRKRLATGASHSAT